MQDHRRKEGIAHPIVTIINFRNYLKIYIWRSRLCVITFRPYIQVFVVINEVDFVLESDPKLFAKVEFVKQINIGKSKMELPIENPLWGEAYTQQTIESIYCKLSEVSYRSVLHK